MSLNSRGAAFFVRRGTPTVQVAGEERDANGASRFSLASDIVELVVLSADEAFLAILREAVGGAIRLWHVPAADKVSDLLLAGDVGILVLDGALIGSDSAGFIEQLKRQFPELVILYAGTREDEAMLAGLISRGAVYRFIHKPMSSARARQFVQAAIRKYDDPRSTQVIAAPFKPTNPPRSLWIGAGAAVLVLALVGFFAWRQMHPSLDATALQSAANAANSDPLLTRAADALAANRLTEPSGDNALEFYLARLARSPDDSTARAGLAEVHERLLARAENALLEERLDEADTAIGAARRAGVESGRIAFLTAQLSKAREQLRQAQSRVRVQGEQRASSDKLSQALQTAAARIDQGRLVDPEGDSALFHVKQAMALAADDVGTQQARRALGAQLLLASRTAMQARDFDKSARLLQAASGISPQADVDSARTALAAARTDVQTESRDKLLKLANERLQQDRLLEPANDSAKYYLISLRALDPAFAGLQPALQDFGGRLMVKARRALSLSQFDAARTWLEEANAAGHSMADIAAARRDLDAGVSAAAGTAARTPASPANLPDVVGATSLTRIKADPPDYPAEAARKRVEGWVDVEFTVRADGSVRDTLIRNAQPAGVFDQAAVRAVAKWRFKPVLRENKPIEQRARIRVRFSLQP
jgi:TonB family protein